MKNYEVEVIKEKMKEIFKEGEVTVSSYRENGYEIEIEKMYDYIEVNFGNLILMSEFFGTTNITVDQESWSGCHTCDYGSSYKKIFYVSDHKD